MKKLLIVVDMQNDFVTGSLGTPEAVAIVENIKAKIEEYRTNGNEIIFTRDTHQENYLDTLEGKKLPVLHCIEGTEGWKLADGMEAPGAVYINKPTFGYLDWDIDAEEIELVGLCTGICVLSNAIILRAKYPNKKITVDALCCACVTPESHKTALEAMKLCQIDVINE